MVNNERSSAGQHPGAPNIYIAVEEVNDESKHINVHGLLKVILIISQVQSRSQIYTKPYLKSTKLDAYVLHLTSNTDVALYQL